MNLSDQVATYVAFKRASGLSFREQERTLADFATWAGERGDSFIRIGTALEWASQASSKARRQRRLRLVRAMAVHLLVEDARHEIPHADALGRVRCHRPPPRLLSPADIRRVMDAALQLPPEGTITPVSFHHIIGLIAATGLRRAEAVNLRVDDVLPDGLLVRSGKNGRERLLPLHASVRAALERHLEARFRFAAQSDHLFVLADGRPVGANLLTQTFVNLTRHLGLRGGPGEPGTRLHDLRHAFAVRSLECVPVNDRQGIGRHMLALSTYLGHASPANSYWYLEATPVLLKRISQASGELHWGGRADD